MEEQLQQKLYDVVILGASGFTGKYVVREALKFLNSPSSPLKTLALAGRNPTKLAQTLKWASSPSPPPSIPILQSDVSDPSSLLSLCRQTKLVLDCVGPFRLYGEPVVAACVEAGADYLDISGEPEFMERMEASYHEKASKVGSLVVSACGFDSVPAELGVMFNSRQWVSPAVPNVVEAYLSLESEKRIVGNVGTYESAVLGVANVEQLQELRRSRPRRARPVIPGPPPPKGPMVEHQKSLGLWAVKLPSADSIVVRRTLATLTENPHGLPGVDESKEHMEKRKVFWSTVKPSHFGVKIGSKSLFGIMRFIITGLCIGLLGRSAFGRSLLLKFPEVFSLGWFRKSGPTEEEVRSASFKMWFVGCGYSDDSLASQAGRKPDTEVITRVSGPEIGYLTTPIILIQCALIVLSQRANLPKGGVLPPGIVFGPTDLQERLQENGISFDFISRKALPDREWQAITSSTMWTIWKSEEQGVSECGDLKLGAWPLLVGVEPMNFYKRNLIHLCCLLRLHKTDTGQYVPQLLSIDHLGRSSTISSWILLNFDGSVNQILTLIRWEEVFCSETVSIRCYVPKLLLWVALLPSRLKPRDTVDCSSVCPTTEF